MQGWGAIRLSCFSGDMLLLLIRVNLFFWYICSIHTFNAFYFRKCFLIKECFEDGLQCWKSPVHFFAGEKSIWAGAVHLFTRLLISELIQLLACFQDIKALQHILISFPTPASFVALFKEKKRQDFNHSSRVLVRPWNISCNMFLPNFIAIFEY